MRQLTCLDCSADISDRGPQAKRCRPCVAERERGQSREAMRRKYRPKTGVLAKATCVDCRSQWMSSAPPSRVAERCSPCRLRFKAACQAERRSNRPVSAPRVDECDHCGIEYKPRHSRTRFCGKDCQRRARIASGAQAEQARRAWLKARFKMTPSEWDALLAAQGGRCAACGTTAPGGRANNWVIDHDHACCPSSVTCGECVRGLLCNRCNRAAGQMADNVVALRQLADYLELHHLERSLRGQTYTPTEKESTHA